MLSWIIRRKIAAFERAFEYDMTYAKDILDVSPDAMLRLARLSGFSGYRGGVPQNEWFAAKLTAVLFADCGPCVQLVVNMATKAGVPSDVVRALVAGDWDVLPEEVRTSAEFARAVLGREPDADTLRDRLEARHGKVGIVGLAFAITSGILIPTLKVALGYGKACTRVSVDGISVSKARNESWPSSTTHSAPSSSNAHA